MESLGGFPPNELRIVILVYEESRVDIRLG
jgi:hypothetical protein